MTDFYNTTLSFLIAWINSESGLEYSDTYLKDGRKPSEDFDRLCVFTEKWILFYKLYHHFKDIGREDLHQELVEFIENSSQILHSSRLCIILPIKYSDFKARKFS